MPFCVATSPAVVTVRTPSTKETGSSGSGTGSQRSGPGGRRTAESGALQHSGRSSRREAPEVLHGRTDAVQPGTLVGHPRCGERRSAQLLGVQPVRHPLR